jgi:hypothetical protein
MDHHTDVAEACTDQVVYEERLKARENHSIQHEGCIFGLIPLVDFSLQRVLHKFWDGTDGFGTRFDESLFACSLLDHAVSTDVLHGHSHPLYSRG